MDYAVEYALMSELYDERCVALEGEMTEYVNTHHGIGKVGAVIKYIWKKICTILANILTAIPRAIATLISGEPMPLHVSEAERIGQLASQRYGEIVTKVNHLTAAACNDILNNSGHKLSEYTNSMERYAEDIEKLKSWFLKYMEESASKVFVEIKNHESDEGCKVFGKDKVAAIVWEGIAKSANFKELCDGIVAGVKPFNKLAQKYQRDPECPKETSETAMRFAAALNRVANIMTTSIYDGKKIIMNIPAD